MVQRFDRNAETETMKQPEGPADSKTSGVFPRVNQRAEAGWGFVIPNPDGSYEIAPATNGGIIGSGEESTIRISGPDVASEHARIEVRADGVYLEDMNTSGGTFVGGVRAQRIDVSHGDVVRFGGRLAVFVERGLNDYMGRAAEGPLVAGPHSYSLFIEPAISHTEAGRSFSIEGGAGMGKRALAEYVARTRESAGPIALIDGAEAHAEAITHARARKPMTYVVFHAEKLPRPVQIELAQAVSRTPGAMAIATFQVPLDRALGDSIVAPALATLFNGRRVPIAPLHARREDIPGLIRALARKIGIDEARLGVEFIEVLTRAGWPGGVTELEQVIREAAEAQPEGVLDANSIKRPLERAPALPPSPPAHDDPALARARLLDALAKAGGSIAAAARTLGMSRQAIYREAQRLGLEVGKRRTTKQT